MDMKYLKFCCNFQEQDLLCPVTSPKSLSLLTDVKESKMFEIGNGVDGVEKTPQTNLHQSDLSTAFHICLYLPRLISFLDIFKQQLWKQSVLICSHL